MRKLLLLCILLLLLVGCSDRKPLEKLGFIRSVGYDIPEANESSTEEFIEVTLVIPNADVRGKKSYVLSTKARASKEARLIISREHDRQLVNGQLRSILFSLDVAKKGVWDYLDSLIRDASVSNTIHILVVDGSAKALLNEDYDMYPPPGQYIEGLLQTERKQITIPKTDMHNFVRNLYDDGKDPVAPILKMKEKNLEISGLALFRKDKYVSQINPKQMFIFNLLHESFHGGEFYLDIPDHHYREHEHIMLSAVSNKRKINVLPRDPADPQSPIKVKITIETRGALTQYLGTFDIANPSEEKKMQKKVADYLEKEAEALIKRFQQLKVDPIGIGQYVRNSMSYKEWKKMNWSEDFADIEVEVKVQVTIKNYGRLEK